MHFRQSLVRGAFPILVLLTVCFLSLPAFAENQGGRDVVKRQLESYAVLLAEEELAGERSEAYLGEASGRLSQLLKRYQGIVSTMAATSTSPISRKHLDISIFGILEQGTAISLQLQEMLQETSLRIDFIQSFSGIAQAVSGQASGEMSDGLSDTGSSVRQLAAQSQKQIVRIEEMQRQAKRLIDRIDKAHMKDKQSLYALWVQYLLAGKTPVFSVDFWSNTLPDARWVNLKQAELLGALTDLKSNAPKFLILFITLVAMGLAAKKLVRYLPEGSSDEAVRSRIRLYYLVSVGGLSLFLATRIIFPAGLDSLAALAASIFLYGILKLAKHICKDKFLSSCGHTRLSLLFLMSAQLLVLHLPGRSSTLIFMLVILSLWGSDTLRVWRRKEQPLATTAMRGGSLALLFVVSFFGYGRLACLITILWCLGIFIRAFGSVWSQSLFMGTEKSSKLQKGLARSLLVPLGWAIAFSITYLWLADFLGKKTLDSVLELKATFGDYALYLKDLLGLAVLFFLTHNCIVAFKVSIEHVGSRWQRAKRGAVPSIQTLVTYATWSFFSLLALRILGVSLTSITVIAGGLSVGIGFGLQNVVNNFISGLILLFGRSIQQGDVIEVNGLWCTVKKINIRTTLVETYESAVIMIPNSDLVTTQVINWTKNNPTLRRDILVGVAYGSDTRKVEETLLKVAAAHPHVLKKPEPFILFNDFGASSLDFILRVWIDDIENTIRATSELRFAIDDAFREAGIEIAFPQMDVHFKTAPAFAGRTKPFGE